MVLTSVTELPFNQHVGIRKASCGDALLILPAGPQFLNHLGTVHAGAQLALAEACSGEFLLQGLTGNENVVPVVRRVDAKFKKPANGTLVARATSDPSVLDAMKQSLSDKGRGLVKISVKLHDESGSLTLIADFEWFIARNDKQSHDLEV
ncbi:MAG: YiiD C-terminal domain-containing protein [Planctomycetales bacterium]|nr:YiiD C-terminal domain-containing protein [Planctomycetales bacterium]